ncbi:MAG: sensor domain-containing diguanylate cyclase [Sarcina sp.]
MEYKKLYEELTSEFQCYQDFAEKKLYEINDKNKQLQKNLNIFTNIIEISKYINLNLFNDNLLDKINDSIVGIFGVSYSTIHLFNGFSLEAKATNSEHISSCKIHYELDLLKNRDSFIINNREEIFKNDSLRDEIHSLIAVPIGTTDNFMGYIVVEHKYYSFFHKEDIKFLEYISNQLFMGMINRNLYKQIQDSVKKDVFLDIYNRKYFYEVLSDIVKKKEIDNYSIVMADIDNFKRINDTYGHQVGDYALKHIVSIVNFNLSNKDFIARYGGEELIMLIDDNHDKNKVIKKIEKMRGDIEKFPLILVDGIKVNMTISFGIAFINCELGCNNMDKIIKIADDNLYKAKRNGRNRVEY